MRSNPLLALLVTLVASFTIWRVWLPDMFSVWTVHKEVRYVKDIAIGLVGVPLGAILLWFSRGDADVLMLAGAIATPHLRPCNLIVLVPAAARLPPI